MRIDKNIETYRWGLKVALYGVLIAMIVMITPIHSYGHASYGYDTDSFITEAEAQKDGSFLVTEKITVDFQAVHHGLFRRIPYDPEKMRIEDVQVPGENFRVQSNTRGDTIFCVIQIGNDKEQLKGKHTYTIKYRLKNFQDSNTSTDLLNLWLIPSEWETPIGYAEGTLIMPESINWNKVEFRKGSYGGKLKELPERVESGAEKNRAFVRAENVQPCTGITVRTTLPEGYWEGSPKYRSPGFYGSIMFLAAGFFALLLFLIFGRKPKPKEIKEVMPPEGMLPVEAGYLLDGKVSDGDLSSMIYRFSQKGYLRISRDSDSGYRLIKLRNIPEYEDSFSKEFFAVLFGNGTDSVRTKTMYRGFIGEADRVKKIIYDKGETGGGRHMYTPWSRVARLFALLGLVAAVIGLAECMFREGGYQKSSLASGMLIIFLGIYFVTSSFTQLVDRFFSSRLITKIGKAIIGGVAAVLTTMFVVKTAKGLFQSPVYGILMCIGMWMVVTVCIFMKTVKPEIVELRGRVIGFRSFLEDFDRSDLKQVDMDIEEYFNTMLPYAFSFGISQDFMEKFKDIEKRDLWHLLETIKWDFRGLRTVKSFKKSRRKQKKH